MTQTGKGRMPGSSKSTPGATLRGKPASSEISAVPFSERKWAKGTRARAIRKRYCHQLYWRCVVVCGELELFRLYHKDECARETVEVAEVP